MTKVFVNGTFDIIHFGHLQLLNYARSLGDSLTVGIDSDERVREKKGPTRPINNVCERQELLANLKAVDCVSVFNTDEELIQLIKDCDIMVKGSDYKGKSIIGETYCKNVIYFDRLNDYSSTKKIQDIINR
jgi:D-beta-D-heptose 7-phosphate kinase/D-beta-D-heptose 1-phosphate adenosyltransferase